MLVDDILDSGLFVLATGQVYDEADERHQKASRLYLESAARTVSDYLCYDVDALEAGTVINGRFMSVNITDSAYNKIKHTVLRIATLMSQEQNGQIGINRESSFNGGRSYLNVVDYTPYLLPICTLCLIGGRMPITSDDGASEGG